MTANFKTYRKEGRMAKMDSDDKAFAIVVVAFFFFASVAVASAAAIEIFGSEPPAAEVSDAD